MYEHYYIVQFQRCDNLPNEEYYYSSHADAVKHFELFRGDDSGLYNRIVLLSWFGEATIELRSMSFP